MHIVVGSSVERMGELAAKAGAEAIKRAVQATGEASVILATGASQFAMLDQLVKMDVDWSKVTCFHLDEYVGIPETHPASFRKYLRERFVSKVGTLKAFHFINPDKDPQRECDRLGRLISGVSIDVAFLGIGENGHLAFNDPPADFATTASYIVVGLDHDCRMQQLGEGWFPTFDDIPSQAISMTISQIMKSKTIIAAVPDKRKALAVKNAVEGPVSVMCPSSVMQTHADCTLFLDPASASLLKKKLKIV